jgi:hypothetical protein
MAPDFQGKLKNHTDNINVHKQMGKGRVESNNPSTRIGREDNSQPSLWSEDIEAEPLHCDKARIRGISL